jgi:AcrR family transcriptional regulator
VGDGRQGSGKRFQAGREIAVIVAQKNTHDGKGANCPVGNGKGSAAQSISACPRRADGENRRMLSTLAIRPCRRYHSNVRFIFPPESKNIMKMPLAKSEKPASTRDRILDTAEEVFMALGYEGASMRLITGDAGVNLAAVNYHFGGKEALFHAVLRRRLDGLNQERLRVLDELEIKANGAPLKASQIVDAFFGTLLRMANKHGKGGQTFLRLIGRTQTEPGEFIRTVLAEEFADVLERYKQALFRALPDVPKEEIVWRFHFMLGATSYAIAGTDTLRLVTDWETGEPDNDIEQLLPRLMSFLLGGLRAPLPEPSRKTPPQRRKKS